MSEKAPHVLNRRANGAPTSQTNESGKGKGSNESTTGRPGKGRGSSERASDTQRNGNDKDTSKPTRSRNRNRSHLEGEKLVIRRLPPGLTQPEFVSILGPDWELGSGKVDWFSYAPGKVSNDPSKPSRPGRAYIHVTKKDDIMPLSEVVRTSTWEDAKCTFTNPSLIGPPSLEFSIYKKVPSGKRRADARQGTIDQDPEFMAFLEGLANPVAPAQNIDADDGDDAGKTEAKVTTTPLIEYLKEKKANRVKENASGKNAKHGRQESNTRGKGGAKDDEPTKKKGKDSKGDKSDKGPKETVKILTKKAAIEQAAEAAKTVADQIKSSSSQDAPKSRRAGIAAAARILQRDLGLSPGSAHRKARQDAAKADTDTKPTASKEASATTSERPVSPSHSTEAPLSNSKSRPATPTTTKSQTSSRRTRGGKNTEKGKSVEAGSSQTTAPPAAPIVLLKKKANNAADAPQAALTAANAQSTNKASGTKSTATPSGQKGGNKSAPSQKKVENVTQNATRGFVKHANPSQGVTEALLKQALEIHGTIAFVEIDKRKGFAYVDFAEHQGLVNAISSSPIQVAQGTVQVLERKDKKTGNPGSTSSPASGTPSASAPAAGNSEKPSGRGRRGRGGGGGKANASSSNQAAAITGSSGG